MVAEMCRAYEQKFNTNNYGVNTLFCQAKKKRIQTVKDICISVMVAFGEADQKT